MLTGDETTSWIDAGPCPEESDDVVCGCDYCNMVGEPCWKARSAQTGRGQ